MLVSTSLALRNSSQVDKIIIIIIIIIDKLFLLYCKPSLRQIPFLWLPLSQSGFYSTDRFHGNSSIHVFLFWREAGKFKICNQTAKKSVNIVILHIETTRRSLKDWNQRWMEKMNIFKCKPLEVHFTIRNRVPYNKQLTNQACLGRIGEYWPSVLHSVHTVTTSDRSVTTWVRTVMTSGQYSPVWPSRSVSKWLILSGASYWKVG